jgi:hypothetical protein
VRGESRNRGEKNSAVFRVFGVAAVPHFHPVFLVGSRNPQLVRRPTNSIVINKIKKELKKELKKDFKKDLKNGKDWKKELKKDF